MGRADFWCKRYDAIDTLVMWFGGLLEELTGGVIAVLVRNTAKGAAGFAVMAVVFEKGMELMMN